MPNTQRLVAPLVAAAVGVVSGVYIFKPLVEQGTNEAKADALAQNAHRAAASEPGATDGAASAAGPAKKPSM